MNHEAPLPAKQPSEAGPPKITVMNTPRTWGTKAQEEKDTQRQEVSFKVTDYIAANERFAGQHVEITFAHKGASSLVSIIETPQEKVVLKMTLDKRPGGERQFLEAWEGAGVSVPHVIEDGLIDDYPYILMDFVDAKTLDTTHTHGELVQEKRYIELGQILRVMHQPVATGYGRFINGRGEFDTFTDYLEQSEYVTKQIKYAEENHIFDDTHGSLAAAKEILTAHVGREPQSSYCHGDFDTCNIFDTKPPTVFDPGMFISNGYLDLGLAIVIALTQWDDAAAVEQLIEGYFGDEPHDARALHAAVLFSSYFKLAAVHEKRKGDEVRRDQQIERVRKYLLQAKQF